jgi:hypothetical protein
MQIRYIVILLSVALTANYSCTKEGIFAKEEADKMSVEGFVKDDASGEAITGVTIYIDAIKAPSGMGLITDGKRKRVGQTATDSKGYYKANLKIFKEAERLEFYLNPGKSKEGYVETQENVYLSDLNRHGNNKLNNTLSPTGLLRIKFKNVQPVSDADFFYYGWYDSGNGWTRGTIQKENCGTIAPSEALTWTGKDVCGIYTVETIAEGFTRVYWNVTKNGVTKNFSDSTFIKRGIINEFSLNY